jgi:pyruvate dehydrogenase E2 component (dihydrolipoamide acetyltransferase)
VSKLRAFTMPKWGIEMQEGTIGEWNVREGDSVQKGQALAQIETDKVINEVVSDFDMTIVRIIGAVGETYPVGALLAVTAAGPASADEIGEFVRGFRSASGAEPAVDPAERPSPSAAENVPPPAGPGQTGAPSPRISAAARDQADARGVDTTQIRGSGRGGRITLQDVQQAAKPAPAPREAAPVSIAPVSSAMDSYYASPFAKRLAVEHAIDLAAIRGTGPRGRISRDDVMKAGQIAPLRPRSRRPHIVRMSATRKTIARQLTASKSTIPHFYLRTQVNTDALFALRLHLRGDKSSGRVPTITDYFIRAAALALMKNPDLNVQVHGDEIHRFPMADIAVAVAADRGLMLVVVRDAESKTIGEIAGESRVLIERARAGKLQGDEMAGGCLTISNLGMFGVEQFDAIISPPQAAILAVGAPRRVAIDAAGDTAFANLVWLSLSCDHRAIDGATGAKFLATLRGLIEAPDEL